MDKTTAEEVEAVRRKLKAYKSRQKEVKQIKADIKAKWDELSGVRSIPFDSPMSAPSTFNDYMKVAKHEDAEPFFIEKAFKLKVAEGCILEVEAILKRLPDEEREIAKRTYVEGESFERVAIDFYMSRSGLFDKLTRAIIKYIITDSSVF